MNVFILILFFHLSGLQAACLPEVPMNKLNLSETSLKASEEVVQRFESIMIRELPQNIEMVVNLEPLNPRVNAEIIKNNQVLSISIWGGMLSHPLITQNSLSLLLCHEIGHFLGGPPLKSRNGWSSTEGQADYYSTFSCIKSFGLSQHEFLEAALNLTRVYAEVSREPNPSPDRCDDNIVNRTNFGYPTVQCRLDTLIAGWNGVKRPACWYFGE